jgi:hypothetical protein
MKYHESPPLQKAQGRGHPAIIKCFLFKLFKSKNSSIRIDVLQKRKEHLENLSKATLQLARELVDDVEMSRIPPEALLLKAMRLARMVDDETAQQWLRFELNGYPNTQEARAWMRRFGRQTDGVMGGEYWVPLAGISGTIAAMQTQIQTLNVPDINFAPSSANPHELVAGLGGLIANTVTQPAREVLSRLQGLTISVSALSSIRSRVLAAIHEFAVSHYHRLAFEGLAESIFEKHRTAVDRLLASEAPDVLEKLPAIYDRLSANDAEAISQAMNSVRRMIKSVADRLYPPSSEPVVQGGQTYGVGSDKVLNRLKLFLDDRCKSGSRRDRLNRAIRDIHERASAGTHVDVTPSEARALFLAAYLTLGEIIELQGSPTQPEPPSLGNQSDASG